MRHVILATATLLAASPVFAQSQAKVTDVVVMRQKLAPARLTPTPTPTPTPAPSGPANIVTNGSGTSAAGWSGDFYISSGAFRVRYINTRTMYQDTSYVAESGSTYSVAFGWSNSQFSSNPVSYTWTVTSNGQTLATGSLNRGARSAAKTVGSFVGTGAPVRFTIVNNYDQDILIDSISITR